MPAQLLNLLSKITKNIINIYCFLRNARGCYLLATLALGITISLTAFLDVLFFNGFVASRLNS